MYLSTPQGITPPTPGLEREEPELMREEDIPSDDGESGVERDEPRAAEDRPLRQLERE
jgi:hypothetical protein